MQQVHVVILRKLAKDPMRNMKIKPCTSPLGQPHKIPHIGWYKQTNKNYFLTVLEDWKFKSRSWFIWFLVRTLFLACRQLSAKIDCQLFPTLTPLPSGAGPQSALGSLSHSTGSVLNCVISFPMEWERARHRALSCASVSCLGLLYCSSARRKACSKKPLVREWDTRAHLNHSIAQRRALLAPQQNHEKEEKRFLSGNFASPALLQKWQTNASCCCC